MLDNKLVSFVRALPRTCCVSWRKVAPSFFHQWRGNVGDKSTLSSPPVSFRSWQRKERWSLSSRFLARKRFYITTSFEHRSHRYYTTGRSCEDSKDDKMAGTTRDPASEQLNDYKKNLKVPSNELRFAFFDLYKFMLSVIIQMSSSLLLFFSSFSPSFRLDLHFY